MQNSIVIDLSKKHKRFKRYRDISVEDYIFMHEEAILSNTNNGKQCVIVALLFREMLCTAKNYFPKASRHT